MFFKLNLTKSDLELESESEFDYHNNIFLLVNIIMVQKKSGKKRKQSNKTKKHIPNKSECSALDSWHFPWNKGKYKKNCEEKGCVFTNSIMGSYCEDPITVTNRKLENIGLDRELFLATLTNKELERILKDNNSVDDEYLTELMNNYTNRRIKAIRDIAVNPKPDLLIHCPDDKILKILVNAEKEKFKKIKSFRELKYMQQGMRFEIFNRNLGNNPSNYASLSWSDIVEILNRCGIDKSDYIYNIARRNFELYSYNSPFYRVSERPEGKCDLDMDCDGTRRCELWKCKNDINSYQVNNNNIVRTQVLPEGSWHNSSRNSFVRRGILFTELKDKNGVWVKTSVPFRPGDSFTNFNGQLKLDYSRKLPGGSWKDTSKNEKIIMGVLFTELKNKNGEWVHNVINFNPWDCFENVDGSLRKVKC